MQDSFTDSQNRQITFETDSDIIAFHNSEQIGSVEFDEEEDPYGASHPRIFNINVNSDYQRAGIGKELIRIAAAMHGSNFLKPPQDAVWRKDDSSSSGYTQEGKQLMDKCIDEGIISPYNKTYDELTYESEQQELREFEEQSQHNETQ